MERKNLNPRNIDPSKDGIDHINIYSGGKTKLGQVLSNFYPYDIKTKDGNFMSVEGYWYWLSIENCADKEPLRKLSGIQATELGKKLLTYKNRRIDDKFQEKIEKAIWYKFKRLSGYLKPKYYDLPFEYYYNFDSGVIDKKDEYSWMIEVIEKQRKSLIEIIEKDKKETATRLHLENLKCPNCGFEKLCTYADLKVQLPIENYDNIDFKKMNLSRVLLLEVNNQEIHCYKCGATVSIKNEVE